MKPKRVRPRRTRDAHTELPFGAVRMQAFCRAHPGQLVYIGRAYSTFHVAASHRGCQALTNEGFVVTPTPAVMDGDLAVCVVTTASH